MIARKRPLELGFPETASRQCVLPTLKSQTGGLCKRLIPEPLETSGNAASCHRSRPASNTWHNARHRSSPDQHRIVGLMLSCFCRKLGSFLGLLAILMVTLAPTVSHALADRNEAGLPSASLCSAHSTPGNPPDNEDASHSLAAHWHAWCHALPDQNPRTSEHRDEPSGVGLQPEASHEDTPRCENDEGDANGWKLRSCGAFLILTTLRLSQSHQLRPACELSPLRSQTVFGIKAPGTFRRLGATSLSAYRRQ